MRARLLLTCLTMALFLSACVAGPGNKPGTMRWKTYTEKIQLNFPPISWTSGGLRIQMTEARYERRHTVLKDLSYSLRFEFKVTNISSGDLNINEAQRPQASLTLADGSQAPNMIWTYSARTNSPVLKPGDEAKGLLFNDNSVPKDARPKTLLINGQIYQWP